MPMKTNFINIIFLFLTFSFIIPSQRNTVTINASSYTDWVYFSFESGNVVEVNNPEVDNGWDLGLIRNHFRTNSGLSGLGNGGAAVDSSQTWSQQLWDNYEINYDLDFRVDEIIPECLYDIITHTMSDTNANPALEEWGWFDLDNGYVFNYNNYVMIVKSESGDYYKFWPSSYYNDYSQSGFVTFSYELIVSSLCSTGDVNSDSYLDVLDVVYIVNYILGLDNFSDEQLCIADLNGDNMVDVVDIVWSVGLILN